jgi:hypothetical protein
MLYWDRLLRVAILVFTFAAVGTAYADDPALQSKLDAAFTAAKAALRTGPADIPLGDVATLHLPEGMGYVPKREAAAIAKLFGNDPGDKFLGWIVPLGESEWRGWLAYNDAGHVSEDDAKNWSDLHAKAKNLRINSSRVVEPALADAYVVCADELLRAEVAGELNVLDSFAAMHGSFPALAREHKRRTDESAAIRA